MASIRPQHPRRRARSASNSSPVPRRSPDNSLRIAAKRTHPIQTLSPMSHGSTPLRWDTDAWKRGKKRRCDTSSVDVTMDFAQDQGQHDMHYPAIPPRSTLPTSSADFNIFPRSDRASRRSASYSSPVRSDSHPNTPSHIELTHLRSNAFWELRRSIAESGEGFIRRMRDYERVRSRQVSDPTRGTRKRSFVLQATRNFSCMRDSDVSDDDDDDDVQILAGEAPGDLFSRSIYRGKRLDVPSHRRLPEAIYPEGTKSTPPSASNQPLTPAYRLDGEGFSIPTNTSSTGSSSVSIPSTVPSLSSPIDPQFLDVDVCSILSLPSSILPLPSYNEPSDSSSSEKAVAELSLALANGAGSLNDYSPLQKITGLQQTDGGEPGELWH